MNNIAELKENIIGIISLRDELIQLKKYDRYTYSLYEYIELFREKLIFTDHGGNDIFWDPKHVALTKLDQLSDIDEESFNSRFSANKTKLLSIMNRYIKDLQHGFHLYDSG